MTTANEIFEQVANEYFGDMEFPVVFDVTGEVCESPFDALRAVDLEHNMMNPFGSALFDRDEFDLAALDSLREAVDIKEFSPLNKWACPDCSGTYGEHPLALEPQIEDGYITGYVCPHCGCHTASPEGDGCIDTTKADTAKAA